MNSLAVTCRRISVFIIPKPGLAAKGKSKPDRGFIRQAMNDARWSGGILEKF